MKLPDKQAIAIAMEIDVHNGTLEIHSLIMFATAGIFVWWVNRALNASRTLTNHANLSIPIHADRQGKVGKLHVQHPSTRLRRGF